MTRHFLEVDTSRALEAGMTFRPLDETVAATSAAEPLSLPTSRTGVDRLQALVAGGAPPVFALEAQEGRLFSPLAYTKTFAMAAAAFLSVTLVPALMILLIRGRSYRLAQPSETEEVPMAASIPARLASFCRRMSLWQWPIVPNCEFVPTLTKRTSHC